MMDIIEYHLTKIEEAKTEIEKVQRSSKELPPLAAISSEIRALTHATLAVTAALLSLQLTMERIADRD